MRPITYSWIGLSAASPLIFLMCAWVLGVFHSYRRYWKSVDLFLLAMFVQELLMALQVFTFALLSLMKPESGIACSVFVWSLSTTRTLQAATATSLLVDRALTSQWPYKYRFSVRRHQIRYHLVVLATTAALVGVAAILARPSSVSPQSFDDCTFLPHNLHVRLALFLLSLYGILLVISAVSIAVVQTMRGCKSNSGASDPLDLTPINLGTTGSSTTTASSGRTLPGRPLHPATSSASTASSTSSGRVGDVLQSASSTTDLVAPPLRPLQTRNTKLHNKHSAALRSPTADFRWKASLAVTGLSFVINHLPYMCLLVIGTFFPSAMPEWPMENMALWLSLSEGLLLPLILGLSDQTFRNSAVSSCAREGIEAQKYEGDQAHFRLFPKEAVKSFPLTNGSLFSSILAMNADAPMQVVVPSYRRDKHKGNSGGTRMGISAHEIRGLVGAGTAGDQYKDNFGRLFYQSEGPSSIGSMTTNSQDPIYSDPTNKTCSSMDSSLKLPEDDHIYATLSETFGSLSSLSDDYLGDHHRCSSATTVANDDFEYHGPKHHHSPGNPMSTGIITSSGCSYVSACNVALAVRPPTLVHNSVNQQISGSYDNDSSLNSLNESSSLRTTSSEGSCDSAETEKITNINPIMGKIPYHFSLNSGYINEAFENEMQPTMMNFPPSITTIECNDTLNQGSVVVDSVDENTLSRKHRSSSLSMNDLDRLNQKEREEEEEMMFILPVKSESMLSLYRLYLAEDNESNGTSLHYSVEFSQSENDLSAISSQKEHVHNEEKAAESIHEIYQKKRTPTASGSRIRRQNKIQRAKGVQQRSKPTIVKHTKPTETPQSNYKESKYWKSEKVQQKVSDEGVKFAIMDKSNRRNGIITIKDPSVLSVEELFSVLNRASEPMNIRSKKRENDNQNRTTNHSAVVNGFQPTTEYKKIFVSEYI